MNIQLPPDVQSSLTAFLVDGRYESEADVLRNALVALRHRDEEIRRLEQDSLAAIKEGITDMEAGRVRPFDEVNEEIRRKYGWIDQP